MEQDRFSFWREASFKIKAAWITFGMAKIIFFPAALMIFIPIDSGSIPILRNTFFFLYCFLVICTLFLCCWEMLSDKKSEIPSEEEVKKWMNFYAERTKKNDQ